MMTKLRSWLLMDIGSFLPGYDQSPALFRALYNVNMFALYFFTPKILPTICQNKTKVPEKSKKFRVQLESEVSYINCAQPI